MRVILHSDLNNFYASVENLYHPELRGKAIVVAGSCDTRHGIVLAKNFEAKRHGITTGDTVFSARAKCPNLAVVTAHHERYLLYSSLVRNIYKEYTNQIEPFGIDEAWLDVTLPAHGNLSEGVKIANAIRAQVIRELGLTVSIGVSYNKIYAKLGSDIKKPNAVTLISEENKKSLIYPLPVNTLLMVGRQTEKKLASYSIKTIGDLASSDLNDLERKFGKNGRTLVEYAGGHCVAPVIASENAPMIKSVGNGNTAPRDLKNIQEVNALLTVLCESVAQRMRKHAVSARTVTLSIKDCELYTISKQQTTDPVYTEKQIRDVALDIFAKCYDWNNGIRALTVTCSNLTERSDLQYSIFCDTERITRIELAEKTIFNIRNRYGYSCIQKGGAFVCPDIACLNPIEDNVIHPLSYKR